MTASAPPGLPDMTTWALDRLEALGRNVSGEPVVVHAQPWSTVVRVPTSDGDTWLKVVAPALRREVAVHAVLAARRPDLVPTPLAADAGHGLLLLPDAGGRLRDLVDRDRDMSPWLEALPRYAELQVAAVDDVPALLAAGVPDLRLAVLPQRFAELVDAVDPTTDPDGDALLGRLRDAVLRVERLCAALAAAGLPETVQHDDLNDGQVYRRPDGWSFLDWGDACVSHPFLSLSVALEGVVAWGPDDVAGSVDTAPFRDAYLRGLSRFGAPSDLADLVPAALRLGWVCRAVNGHHAGLEQPARTWTRLRMFLDGRP